MLISATRWISLCHAPLDRKLHARINPGAWPYSIDFSINPSVLAFSIRVRTFARSSPDGISAAISTAPLAPAHSRQAQQERRRLRVVVALADEHLPRPA
jgi:hypothetical protein